MDEATVLKLIAKFLEDQGLEKSLAVFLGEAKVTLDPTQPSGALRSMLDEVHEHNLALKKATNQSRPDCADLDVEGDGDYCEKEVLKCAPNSGSNIIACALKEDGTILSGGADRCVVLTQPDDTSAIEITVKDENLHSLGTCSAPVVCMASNPVDESVFIYGDMSGVAALCRICSNSDSEAPKMEVLTKHKHQKYVVTVQWSPYGNFYASGSYDNTVKVCAFNPEEPESSDVIKELKFQGQVEALAFRSSNSEESTNDQNTVLFVGVRGDHRIHCISVQDGSVDYINMNSFGDDFVSFNAMYLSVSPNGKYLLVSTDKERLILFDIASKQQVRNFYGAKNDEYSNPRHAWHPSGLYIYATSQTNCIVVWEVSSQQPVHELKGHTANIRDLKYCKKLGLLVSCGFDKTLRLWRSY